MAEEQLKHVTKSKAVSSRLLFVVIAAVLGASIVYVERKTATPTNAVKATAQVIALAPSPCMVLPEHHICPELTVRVFPAQGERYEAKIETRLNEMWASRVQPGAWLTVQVDAKDRLQVFVDIEALSLQAPSSVSM